MLKNTTERAQNFCEKEDNLNVSNNVVIYCPKSLGVWHMFLSASFPAFLQDFVAYYPSSTSVNYVQNDNATIPKTKTEFRWSSQL